MRSILKKLKNLIRGKATKEKKVRQTAKPGASFHLNMKEVFDKSKGIYSVRQAAEMLGMEKHRLYRSIREKKIPHILREGFYALHIDDINEYEKTLRRVA